MKKEIIIIDIIKVSLEAMLLELHFNVLNQKKKQSFSLCINYDGESIIVLKNDDWIKISEIDYKDFSIVSVNKKNSLARLIGNNIKNIQCGVESVNMSKEKITYYFKIDTDKNQFLFFNNGDEGYYSFNNIKEILDESIFDFHWEKLFG